MIGYRGAANFISAVLNGLAGAIDITKIEGYNNRTLPVDYAYNFAKNDATNHIFMNWLYALTQRTKTRLYILSK